MCANKRGEFHEALQRPRAGMCLIEVTQRPQNSGGSRYRKYRWFSRRLDADGSQLVQELYDELEQVSKFEHARIEWLTARKPNAANRQSLRVLIVPATRAIDKPRGWPLPTLVKFLARSLLYLVRGDRLNY
jgi:hypothetical protein